MRNNKGDRSRPENQSKDSNSYRIIATVRKLFLDGNKLTAKDINRATCSNDARKVISVLRADGWNIQDIRLSDNCKLYWLATPDTQLPLFEKGGNDER